MAADQEQSGDRLKALKQEYHELRVTFLASARCFCTHLQVCTVLHSVAAAPLEPDGNPAAGCEEAGGAVQERGGDTGEGDDYPPKLHAQQVREGREGVW